MNTKQKTKPVDPCLWLDDAVEKVDRWRVIYFLKCGKTLRGDRRYPTEVSAQAEIDKAEASAQGKWERTGLAPTIIIGESNTGHSWDEISYALPFPVKS